MQDEFLDSIMGSSSIGKAVDQPQVSTGAADPFLDSIMGQTVSKPALTSSVESPKVNVDAYDPLKIMQKMIVPKVGKEESTGAMLALHKVWGLAKNPYDIIKGSAEFVASLPGFGEGLIGAAWGISKAIGQGANLSQAYEAASKGMEENSASWKNAVVDPLGRLLDTPKTLGKLAAEKITGIKNKDEESYSEVVGEIAMAPLNLITKITHSVADAEWLNSYPNAKGAIQFGGDVLGLLTMGRIYKGGPSEFAKDVEPIIMQADKINKQQKVVDEIPNEILKKAQEKVLEVEKNQLELAAKALQEKVDHEKVVKEDLKIKGEEIAKIKAGESIDLTGYREIVEGESFPRGSEYKIDEATGKRYVKVAESLEKAETKISKTEISEDDRSLLESLGYEKEEIAAMKSEDITRILSDDESIKPLNELEQPTGLAKSGIDVLEPKEVSTDEAIWIKRAKKVGGVKFNGLQSLGKGKGSLPMFTLDREDIPKTTFMVGKGETLEKAIARKYKEAAKAEPITDLDLQTGTPLPKGLDPNNHPFRDKNKEHTDSMNQLFIEKIKNKEVDPEVFTRYLINEVNRYLNGDTPSTPIEKIRDGLRNAVINAENVRLKFDSKESFEQWRNTVSEASRWASESIGSMNKRTGGTQLNMMIPVNEIPEMVKDLLRKFKVGVDKVKLDSDYFFTGEDNKVIPGSSLYRNKEVFDKTGFWFGKDGKWRYEIDDKDIHYEKFLDHYKKTGDNLGYVKDIVDKELLQAVPGLYQVAFIVARELKEAGNYNSLTRLIRIKKATDVNSFIHELQHAVNDIMGSRFKGTSPSFEDAKATIKLFSDLEKVAKDPEVKSIIETIKKQQENALNNLPRTFRSDFLDPVLEKAKYTEDFSKVYNVINDFLSETSFEKYLKDPGEMEARLASKRMEMSAEERKAEPPWETLDTMLDVEGFGDGYNSTGPVKAGTKLYSGIDLPEATKKIIKSMSEFMKSFDDSQNLKRFEIAYAAKQLKGDIIQGLVDQQETLLKEVRKLYPKESQRIIDRQRSAANGKGYGEIEYNQLSKEVFDGKSDKQVRLINAYILARRLKDIYGYRTEKEYKAQPGYEPNNVASTTSIIEMIQELPEGTWASLTKIPEIKKIFGDVTQKEVIDAVNSAEIFFDWHKKIVDDLVEAEMKSEVEGELLKAHDYRKFKTLSVEKLYDFDYQTHLRGETIRSTNSGVQSLGHGSTKIIDPDARVSAHEMAIRAYGSIANQAAKMEWKGLAEKYPDNTLVSLTQKSGWSPMPYFKAGVKKEIYFSPEAAKYMVTRSHDVSQRLSMIMRGATFAPFTRSLAVGTSPIWATFVGLPMDVLHTLWTAKTWEVDATKVNPSLSFPFFKTIKGDYKRVYSPYNPLSPLQLGLDMSRTLGDVYTRGPLFKNMAKHGLAMPFMSMRENRYIKGAKPPGDWAKLIDILSYHGVSMETWVRAATADRVIRRRAEQRGMSYEEALKNHDIMYEAVHAARDRMDYNQGGWIVKALDQNGMIFLNAAVLGTRTFWRSAKENPVDFAARSIQLAALATGITAMAWSHYEDVMKDIPTEGNEKNIVWPLFPDWINFKDENGDTRYIYAKLRMDPGPAFMYKFADHLTRTYLFDKGIIKQEPDYGKITDSLKQLGPIGLSLPPSIQLGYDYSTNTSWWKDRQMYTDLGGKTLDWPKSKHEGEFDPNVSQLAKDVGSVTGLSPKRLQGSVSNVIPSNNEFVAMFGGAYNQAFSDVPESDRKRPLIETLANIPGFNRVIGLTQPGYSRRQIRDDVKADEDLKHIVNYGKFDLLATDYAWRKSRKREEVLEYISSQKEKKDYENMRDKFIFIEKTKDLKHRNTWLGMWHMSPEVRAREYIKSYDSSTEKGKVQLEKELMQINAMNIGYISDEFKQAYMKIQDAKTRENK